jgi:hypothetical protein
MDLGSHREGFSFEEAHEREQMVRGELPVYLVSRETKRQRNLALYI